jgi:hypothetical protein
MQATVACKKSAVNTKNWNWGGGDTAELSASDQHFIGHYAHLCRMY